MENYLSALKKCPLFDGIAENELLSLLKCLSANEKRYEKNSFVFMADDAAVAIGIVLYGGVHVIREDIWGNSAILANIDEGGMFGEAFSCAEIEKLPVSVLAAKDSGILFIDYRKIVTTCSSTCVFHSILIRNMLGILARKNIMLTQKIGFLTRRTTREKLLAYLSAQAQQTGSNSFAIPFNRQELAEYLSVDRSAMSSELSKMQADGILTFKRKEFKLLKTD